MRITVLGQIDGPIGGQSRLTQAFREGRKGQTDFIEFWGHKSWRGPFRIVSQFIRSVILVVLRRTEAAYIATSRSNFGMLRDLVLLLPYILGRIPVVAHVHGADFDDFYLRSNRFRAIKNFYLKHVTSFIFVNEVFVPRDSVVGPRSTFVRNPIPLFALSAMGAPAGPIPKGARPCFGFISTFAKEKGIESFLEAAERFHDRADFVVAGGPSIENPTYGHAILSQISGMGFIRYLGYLSDPTPFYDSCDFMIFPTNFASETSSLVVIEALATRTRPIVRRHNRLCDIFGDAPVEWFTDNDELFESVERSLALPVGEMTEALDRGQAWVRATFPSETEWVDRVEAIVAKAAKVA